MVNAYGREVSGEVSLEKIVWLTIETCLNSSHFLMRVHLNIQRFIILPIYHYISQSVHIQTLGLIACRVRELFLFFLSSRQTIRLILLLSDLTLFTQGPLDAAVDPGHERGQRKGREHGRVAQGGRHAG